MASPICFESQRFTDLVDVTRMTRVTRSLSKLYFGEGR